MVNDTVLKTNYFLKGKMGRVRLLCILGTLPGHYNLYFYIIKCFPKTVQWRIILSRLNRMDFSHFYRWWWDKGKIYEKQHMR